MVRACLVIGLLLVALGVGSYLASDGASKTALIPAAFGALFLLLGAMARNEARRALAMHIAVVVAVLGLAGSARGIPDAIALASGETVERPTAAVAQAAMVVLCAVFVVLAVRSFAQARAARKG